MVNYDNFAWKRSVTGWWLWRKRDSFCDPGFGFIICLYLVTAYTQHCVSLYRCILQKHLFIRRKWMLFSVHSTLTFQMLKRKTVHWTPDDQTAYVYNNVYMQKLMTRLHATDKGRLLQWRHNERDDVSNDRRFDSSLNRLFRRRSKKTSKLRVTGLCEGNSPVPDEFRAQRASITRKCFHLMTSSCVALISHR